MRSSYRRGAARFRRVSHGVVSPGRRGSAAASSIVEEEIKLKLVPFAITVKQHDRATVISCRGEIDVATVADLELAIDAALERPLLLLVVDLEGVTFMD